MLKVNKERLWDSVMEMATLGATPKGGSRRLALTEIDGEGRNLFIKWCEAEGLTLKVDLIGNLFAVRQGRNSDALPIVMGSHLDTQPKGGKFDGVYGVLAALEVIRTLNDAKIETEHNLEIAVWTNEEGARFSPAMLGSAVFIGELGLEEALAIKDHQGVSVGDSLDEIGFRGKEPLKRLFNAYFEAHIEQGPILENNEKMIGVVTGGQAISWLNVTISGMPAHAGTTPMAVRKDPLLAVADILLAIEAAAIKVNNVLFTIGEIIIANPSRNTIPDVVTFTLDLRHPDITQLNEFEKSVKEIVGVIAKSRGVTAVIDDVWLSPAIPFDPACVDLVREATEQLGYSYQEIISGAGHDAIHLAKHCPTTMIFIPCVDGISHNEAETIYPIDAERGANVLLHAVIERDQK